MAIVESVLKGKKHAHIHAALIRNEARQAYTYIRSRLLNSDNQTEHHFKADTQSQIRVINDVRLFPRF